jgi:hypothetical protein
VQVGEDVVFEKEVEDARLILVTPQNVLCNTRHSTTEQAKALQWSHQLIPAALDVYKMGLRPKTSNQQVVLIWTPPAAATTAPAIVLIVSTTTARFCSVTTPAEATSTGPGTGASTLLDMTSLTSSNCKEKVI